MTLWLLVVAIGAFHGLSPGMGWPLAVSNGLFARDGRAVVTAMVPLAAGHFLAMAAVLLPFAVLAAYLDWSWAIRVAAGVAVVAFGVWRLVDTGHPRAMARVRPTQLTLWSFLMATAHGAALMLIPMVLGLCTRARSAPAGGDAAAAMATIMETSLGAAVAVAIVHTLAMLTAGGTLAWIVYRWLGVRAIGASWFNLDRVWAASLILSGAVCCAAAVTA